MGNLKQVGEYQATSGRIVTVFEDSKQVRHRIITSNGECGPLKFVGRRSESLDMAFELIAEYETNIAQEWAKALVNHECALKRRRERLTFLQSIKAEVGAYNSARKAHRAKQMPKKDSKEVPRLTCSVVGCYGPVYRDSKCYAHWESGED
jgi:hypothetical protein